MAFFLWTVILKMQLKI